MIYNNFSGVNRNRNVKDDTNNNHKTYIQV